MTSDAAVWTTSARIRVRTRTTVVPHLTRRISLTTSTERISSLNTSDACMLPGSGATARSLKLRKSAMTSSRPLKLFGLAAGMSNASHLPRAPVASVDSISSNGMIEWSMLVVTTRKVTRNMKPRILSCANGQLKKTSFGKWMGSGSWSAFARSEV